MKKIMMSLLMLVVLSSGSTCFADAKADGSQFIPDDTFKPGVYVAVKDANAYSDAYPAATWREYNIKKGTRLNVYAAGHNTEGKGATWFNLAEGHACNGGKIKGFDGEFLGFQSKDFKRIGDAQPCK